MLEVAEKDEVFGEFTVREVFEALAKNGFAHLRSEWYLEDLDGVIRGGCVLTQGAMNLGVEAESEESNKTYSLYVQLNRYKVDPDSKWAPATHYLYNKKPVGIGSTIVEWNDKADPNDTSKYILKTYEDVIAMAREVMEPHFNKKIKLRKRVWNAERIKPETSEVTN